MPGIVEFPTIVQQAAQQFGAVFANQPERRHFAEYLTGLLVAAKKNVSGINAEFAATTDQSCLNRWITEVAWDEVALNRHRLAWLQQDAQTRYAESGVIPIDNTLVDHDGKLIRLVAMYGINNSAVFQLYYLVRPNLKNTSKIGNCLLFSLGFQFCKISSQVQIYCCFSSQQVY